MTVRDPEGARDPFRRRVPAGQLAGVEEVEWAFTAIFTVEYGLRLICSPRPTAYARRFFGVVDLASILPTYVSLILPGTQHFQAFMGVGLAMLGMAAVVFLGDVPGTGSGSSARVVAMLAMISGGFFAVGALRLPAWARLRANQMRQLAERVGGSDRTASAETPKIE